MSHRRPTVEAVLGIVPHGTAAPREPVPRPTEDLERAPPEAARQLHSLAPAGPRDASTAALTETLRLLRAVPSPGAPADVRAWVRVLAQSDPWPLHALQALAPEPAWWAAARLVVWRAHHGVLAQPGRLEAHPAGARARVEALNELLEAGERIAWARAEVAVDGARIRRLVEALWRAPVPRHGRGDWYVDVVDWAMRVPELDRVGRAALQQLAGQGYAHPARLTLRTRWDPLP